MHSNVISWDQRYEQGSTAATYSKKFLAEGDSWFSLGGIPTSNLLFSLDLPDQSLVINCATPGDTIRHMSEIAANRELNAALSARFGDQWDAIFLSGGGNDLIDAVHDILLTSSARTAAITPQQYCDTKALNALCTQVVAGYQAIVAMRDAPDSACKGAPIFIHTYDYPTPRDSPARFFLSPVKGPWLYSAFVGAGIPASDWVDLSDYLMNRLAIALLAMRLPGVFCIDTRNTIERAVLGSIGVSGDWQNEIHPTSAGYAKIGAKMSAAINARLAL